MSSHAEFLELAAAAIDFDLEPAEQTRLDSHLAVCIRCRRRVIALQHDARATRQLPAFELAPARAQRIWRHIDEPRRASIAALRLVVVAALLGLVALSALAVGASLLRRDNDLSEAVTLPPVAVESPSASAEPTTPSATSPDPERVVGFNPDTVVEIVVTDLRVRTEPTVDDARSAKLEPLLGLGTRLRVVEGPVMADDYEWYRVEAIGWPHRGWVAAADHDGEPWIEDPALRGGQSAAMSELEESIRAGLRPDAAESCGPRTAGLPTGAIGGIECKLGTALVVRVGAYRFDAAQGATTAYLERLSLSGVTFGSGDCASGTSGDAAWSLGDSEVVQFGGSWWAPGRIGCFTDQYGAANVRVTCGPTYVGILGRTSDLRALHEWASENEARSSGSPPGICRGLPAD